jgi:hypothetical protein
MSFAQHCWTSVQYAVFAHCAYRPHRQRKATTSLFRLRGDSSAGKRRRKVIVFVLTLRGVCGGFQVEIRAASDDGLGASDRTLPGELGARLHSGSAGLGTSGRFDK